MLRHLTSVWNLEICGTFPWVYEKTVSGHQGQAMLARHPHRRISRSCFTRLITASSHAIFSPPAAQHCRRKPADQGSADSHRHLLARRGPSRRESQLLFYRNSTSSESEGGSFSPSSVLFATEVAGRVLRPVSDRGGCALVSPCFEGEAGGSTFEMSPKGSPPPERGTRPSSARSRGTKPGTPNGRFWLLCI